MEKSFRRLKTIDARAAYVEAELVQGLSAQIRTLRNSRNWSQEELAKKLGTSQNAVSRMENSSYGRYSIKTLLAVSKVFDVGLVTRFVPFSQLISITWDTRPEALAADSYEDESSRVVAYSSNPAQYHTQTNLISETLSAHSKMQIVSSFVSSNYLTDSKNLEVINYVK